MKKAAILLVFLALVISACTPSTGISKEQAAAQADDAHRGFNGVTINFIKNSPPDVVFTGNPLDVVVEVKNEGASSATGTLYLTGYDQNIFGIQPRYVDFTLEGRSRFNSFGGYDALDFTSNPVVLPLGTDTLDQNFLVSACYVYRTEARIPVCIDPDPYSLLETEACKVVNPAIAGGQGGPVGVAAIQENAAPGQVGFLISVANQGDGQVIDAKSLSKCPTPLGYNDVDTVDYSVRLSGVVGDCKPVQKIRLANKQGQLYCAFNLADTSSPAYTSVLEINLDYGYLSQKSKIIKVKSLT